MRKMMTTVLSLIVALGLTVMTTVWAQTQGFPQKPIKLIVPYPPGGATDIVSRAAATEMSKALGQPVIIENRPGAGGNLGSELVARAIPDGYTMLTSPSSVHGITPFLYARLNYDPNKDLAGVIVLASLANVLVVSPGLKVQNVRELVALAKAQPGKLSCASSGSGSTIHLSCEMFKQLYGLNIIHIPYKGSAFAITDLLAGHVDLMFDNIPSAITHIRAGKLKALATTGATRSATLPDLPTMVEAGAAGYESTAWFGLSVPAGTPRAIIDRLHHAGMEAVKSQEFVRRMAQMGYDVVGSTPDEMSRMIQLEVARWGPIVKASGAKVD